MTVDDIASDPVVRDLIRRALEEDVGPGDATSLALVEAGRQVEAVIQARQDLVVCGGPVARAVFAAVDPALVCTTVVPDGRSAGAGDVLMTLRGSARAVLTGERTALNFMQRLSGMATLTRRFVERVSAHGTVILDTRKTTPTLRVLEKYAVRMGGGRNHRVGLYDRVLIKDNHRRLAAGPGGLGLDAAVMRARAQYPSLEIEVEVESLEELEQALKARPEWILLDNMPPQAMTACVRGVAGACRLEASGGITLANIEAVAATGVDAVSLGCLTHSAPAADLSLEITADLGVA